MTVKFSNGILALIAALAFPGLAGAAEDANVAEIVRKSNLAAYYAGKDGRSEVAMTIVDSQGRATSRNFAILRLDVEDGGKQKFYVFFHKPADVRNTVFMVWKNIGKDDDRWLYLPALDLVKRIAASDKRSSFVGSNFFYEDVSGRGVEEDEHSLAETTDKYFVLKNVPKRPADVEFSHYLLWVDRATYLPAKAEYHDKNGKKYRRVEALEVKEIQGHPTVTKARVDDLNSNGHTISEFVDVRYDLGLEESIFSERYLRRPPREWLK